MNSINKFLHISLIFFVTEEVLGLKCSHTDTEKCMGMLNEKEALDCFKKPKITLMEEKKEGALCAKLIFLLDNIHYIRIRRINRPNEHLCKYNLLDLQVIYEAKIMKRTGKVPIPIRCMYCVEENCNRPENDKNEKKIKSRAAKYLEVGNEATTTIIP